MSNAFVQQDAVQHLLRESAGLNATGGDERFKMIVHRLLENLCTLIDDYNVTEEEFWHAVNYLHELGGRQEAALLAAGLGLEHFLDLRQELARLLAPDNGLPEAMRKDIEAVMGMIIAKIKVRHAQ